MNRFVQNLENLCKTKKIDIFCTKAKAGTRVQVYADFLIKLVAIFIAIYIAFIVIDSVGK